MAPPLQQQFRQSAHFEGGQVHGPHVQFDSEVPAGVDPDALWRKQNSQRFKHFGATPDERADKSPGYTPGYGRGSLQNPGLNRNSLTNKANWDANFTPILGPTMQQRRTGSDIPPPQVFPDNPAANAAAAEAARADAQMHPVLPQPANPGIPSPSPAPAPPVIPAPAPLPPSPGTIDQVSGHPIQQVNASNGVVQRSVQGLPAGQIAGASFFPGQNTPANLAKRPRQPVDPYS